MRSRKEQTISLKYERRELEAAISCSASSKGTMSFQKLSYFFPRWERTNGWNSISTRIGLREVFKGKDYRALEKAFSFVKAFSYQRTKHKKSAPMTLVHMWYKEIVGKVTVDKGNQAWREKRLGRLERRVKGFRRMLVERFDEDLNSGLYTSKYSLRDEMVEEIQRFEMLSVSDSSSYEYLHVHINQAFRSAS